MTQRPARVLRDVLQGLGTACAGSGALPVSSGMGLGVGSMMPIPAVQQQIPKKQRCCDYRDEEAGPE